MYKKKLVFAIDHDSDIPKYRQLVNTINTAIAKKDIQNGDQLPSVNSICQEYNLSRDTVFKAYSLLKEQGVVDAVPNKGYFVATDVKRVLLVLDTFKAYKEVLYHSFINNLPDDIITDVQFHHYSIDNFKVILNNSIGKYYKYVVMPFDDKEIPSILSVIDKDKLLLIDWNVHSKTDNNYVYQDFGAAFEKGLEDALERLRKYRQIHFLYPDFTNHPAETITHFKRFCRKFDLTCKVLTDPGAFDIEKGTAYLSVSDRMLGSFLEQCREKNYEPGVEVGILSYNDTPMKKFIYKGISVISTDFRELGSKAAEFIKKDQPVQLYIPTELIIRESL